MVVTETGYHNAVNDPSIEHRPVSELAAGKYMPRLLLEYFNRGFGGTYLYELIDSQPDAARAVATPTSASCATAAPRSPHSAPFRVC